MAELTLKISERNYEKSHAQLHILEICFYNTYIWTFIFLFPTSYEVLAIYWMQANKKIILQEEEQEGDEEAEDEEGLRGPDYDYLLGMKMWSLTLERKNEILKNRDDKRQELKVLKDKTPEVLWNTDLDNFLELVSQI